MAFGVGSRRLSVLAVSLVVVTLLGSVLIPARLTWRIIGELDRIAAVPPRVAQTIDEVRTLEERSLIVNGALVVVALGAVMSVVALTRRERRLAGTLRRRLVQESALREAAEALAQTFTIEAVTEQIVHMAVQAGVASGAFVEHIVAATRESAALAVVQATAGAGMPTPGTSQPYESSHAQRAIDRGEPMLLAELALPPSAAPSAGPAPSVSAIVVPLTHTTAPIGALFLVNPERSRSGASRLGAPYTFGKLATLAYEKVRLLEEAREGRRQLERAMQSRSRLMRGFSHDVKNSLGVADGYAELLTLGIHGELTLEQTKTAGHIRRSIHTALALIDDLHQLGRVETGNVVLDKTAVDLGDLVRAVGDDYQAAAKAKGLALTVDVPRELPCIETDRTRVRQIVGNLMSNAIKYTARGSVTLRLSHGQSASDELKGLRIDVVDTGPGISPEKHDLIFEEFSRLGTEQAGAGLGLAISKLLAEALDGHISLVSRCGFGSTFSLWLPFREREEGTVVSTPPRALAYVQ